MSRSPGTPPLLVGLAGIVVGALLGYWGGTLLLAVDNAATTADDRSSYPLIIVIVGAIIGIGVPLLALGWYLRRRLPVARTPHQVQALWIALAWGSIAYVLAGTFNGPARALSAGEIYPGLIEEFLKLLLPVILLLSSRTYRSPVLAAWLVFVIASWLGFVEGISYIITALDPILDGGPVPSDAPFIMMMTINVRIIAEITHPLITVGAAILIWLAAHTLPKALAAGVALLAYLGAAAIHGLNDAVLNGPVRDWNIPLSIALTAIYAAAILLFWFRPQVLRLQKYEMGNPATAPTGRAPGTSR